MSDIAIQIEGISKRYQLGVISRKTLQDEVRFLWHRLLGRDPRLHMGKVVTGSAENAAPDNYEDGEQIFWALQDVSFNVEAGEVVGIIGRNGAGKTTLLKVLSRITEPTCGQAVIDGRMGSLLEVGTGFHPEMTGRENIFLNGSILGMRKAEIQKKYDDIVAFSELARFIDTPVKRYSSGMFVRLAFSVAAHLDPEILLIDEVLAVGDAGFQRKCIGKMGDVASGGRTILFVSHNMAAVQQLCTRCVVLERGKVYFAGNTADAIRAYMKLVGEAQSLQLADRTDRKGNGVLRFTNVSLHHDDGEETELFFSGEDVRIRLHYRANQRIENAQARVVVKISSDQGQLLTTLSSLDTGDSATTVHREGYFECRLPRLNLRRGQYMCTAYCMVNGDMADLLREAFQFRVEDGDFYGTGRLSEWGFAPVLTNHRWTNVPTSESITQA
jgi:lipopolysaccharide transport system ATP-binding protein